MSNPAESRKRQREPLEDGEVQEFEQIRLRRSALPEYLTCGEFFKSLVPTATSDEVCVPKDCYKGSTEIKNNADLKLLLNTLRYWSVQAPPLSLVTYLFMRDRASALEICEKCASEIPHLNHIIQVARVPREYASRAIMVASIGSVYLLDILCEKNTIPKACLNVAAKCGQVESMR